MTQIIYQDIYCDRDYAACVRYKLKISAARAQRRRLPPCPPQPDDATPQERGNNSTNGQMTL